MKWTTKKDGLAVSELRHQRHIARVSVLGPLATRYRRTQARRPQKERGRSSDDAVFQKRSVWSGPGWKGPELGGGYQSCLDLTRRGKRSVEGGARHLRGCSRSLIERFAKGFELDTHAKDDASRPIKIDMVGKEERGPSGGKELEIPLDCVDGSVGQSATRLDLSELSIPQKGYGDLPFRKQRGVRRHRDREGF